MKIKFIKWLASILLGNNYDILLVRKKYLHEIARQVNRFPQSKIDVLKIIRLDGTDFKTAMEIYNKMNGGE